ncbi:major facilitator superfamily domain-containing protein [Mycena galopus ATCC 62051]|nr:major facilitator superfamily domain-containing protein [Mycena galopus ATCC 62051]
MAIFLYRYINRKRNERKAATTDYIGIELDDTSPIPFSTQQNNSTDSRNVDDSTGGAANASGNATVPQTRIPAKKTDWKWRLELSAALFIPIFLETLDYTVVATAQPRVASIFNRLDLQSYIGTAYLLTSAVFLPVFAQLADIFGRHATLQLALFLFMIGSAISTGAVSMIMLLVGRGLAGVGAAGLLASVRTIVADARSLDDNNWQQTLMFILFAAGFSVGPVIGGYLLDTSFRWIFGINLPACAVAIVLCFLFLRGKVQSGQAASNLPSNPSSTSAVKAKLHSLGRMDWLGAILFIAGGILILLALNWGSTNGWKSARVIACFVVGGVLMIIFILWENVLQSQVESGAGTASHMSKSGPMIPVEVFKSFDNCAVQYGSFVSGMVMLVMFYFVAIFMTIVYQLSATQAGIQLVFFAPGLGAGSVIAIILIGSIRQPRIPLFFGAVTMCVALALLQMAMATGKKSEVNGFMAMAGAGVGMTFGPLGIQARFTQSEDKIAAVTGLTLFFRSLGGTVGLAQCAAVLSSRVTAFLASAVKSGAIPAQYISSIADANINLNSLNSIDGLPDEIQELVRSAFRDGSRWAMISLIPWCAVSVFLSLGLSKIGDTDRQKIPSVAVGGEKRGDA